MPLGLFLCNRCGKSFASKSLEQNHQNQCSSNCWKNYSILLQAEPASSSNPDTSGNVHFLPSTPTPLSPSRSVMMDVRDPMDATWMDPMDAVDPMDAMDPMEVMDPMDVTAMDGANDPSNDQYPEQDATILHTELFPGASEIYGKGKTYMDLFDDNEYAGNRETNPYYPFASQPEWELASFLLKSGLSMVAMDEFLKLQMVSAGVPLLNIWLICRSQTSDYHSKQQRIFIIVRKFSRPSNQSRASHILDKICSGLLILIKVFAGSRKKSTPRAPPRKTLSSIIEIHFFAFNTSCKILWLRTISRFRCSSSMSLLQTYEGIH